MWKPMTTAPKDGHILLIAIAAIGGTQTAAVVGYWSRHRDAWVDAIIESGVSKSYQRLGWKFQSSN